VNLPLHACAGVICQEATGDWKKAVPLAFFSHLFLDALYPKYHDATLVMVAFNVVATSLILWRWRHCWLGIVAACSWDLEWVYAHLFIGCPPTGCEWSIIHRFFLWDGWKSTPWFGVFEMALALMILLLLWRGGERARSPTSRWRRIAQLRRAQRPLHREPRGAWARSWLSSAPTAPARPASSTASTASTALTGERSPSRTRISPACRRTRSPP